jgi:outer membrane lipoprotein-sorting protein
MRPTLFLALAATTVFAVQGPKSKVDPGQKKAQLAYEALQTKLQKARSVKLNLEVHNLGEVDKYDFSFLRDNYAKIVSPNSGIYQNGKTYYDYDPVGKEYWTRPAPLKGLPQGTAFSLGGLTGLETLGFNNEPKMVAESIVQKKWNGETAKAINLHGEMDPNIKATLYLDSDSGLPVGWEFKLREFRSSGIFKNIQLNAPLKASDFNWMPPAGSKKIDG